MKQKQPCFRCPECHFTFYSADAVTAHRSEKQGACYDELIPYMRGRIDKYRSEFQPAIPPMPEPEPEFDVIED